jgi:uncharacterized membrane protein
MGVPVVEAGVLTQLFRWIYGFGVSSTVVSVLDKLAL